MSVLLAQASGSPDTAEVVLFVVFATIALGAAMAVVTMRNIVHAALMLVLNFLSIAALFLGLQSAFLAIGQVIVYAGAIMVLFLFVIMLLGVDRDDLLTAGPGRNRVLAVLGVAAVAGVLLFGFAGTYTGSGSLCGDQAPDDIPMNVQPCVGLDDVLAGEGSGSFIANRMFGRYTFPFELAAVLLTVATVGAMVLGRRREPDQDDDPAFQPSADLPDPDDPETVAVAAALSEGGASAGTPLVTDDPDVVEAQRRLADDAGDADGAGDVGDPGARDQAEDD
jgi:NADH-quinone oxidoreductase subunit J